MKPHPYSFLFWTSLKTYTLKNLENREVDLESVSFAAVPW